MMSANMTIGRSAVSRRLRGPGGVAGLVMRIEDVAAAWRARARLRGELRRLAMTGDHLLRDAGFDPAWARREMAKPVWQA